MAVKKRVVSLNDHDRHQFITSNLQSLYEILDIKYADQGGPYDFKNDVFEMHHGRSTHIDSSKADFICGDVEISWYKYIGRSMVMNCEMSFDDLDEMFCRCRLSLRAKR